MLEHEPTLALFAENNGLAIYQKICRQLKDHLKNDGSLYLEIGFLQGKAVVEMFEKAYPKAEVTLKKTKADMIGWSEFVFELGKGKRC